MEFVVVLCWRLTDVLGLLWHPFVVLFLVIVVNRCQMVFLAVDLWQVDIHINVVDADFGAMCRLGVCDSCCLRNVADQVHLDATR